MDVLLGVGFDDFLVELDSEAVTLGELEVAVSDFGEAGAVSRTQGSAKSLKYSWMRKFVVQAARWRAAAVLIWPPTLCGAMVT